MNNQENFDLEFSFISSGLSIIKKNKCKIGSRAKNILKKIP